MTWTGTSTVPSDVVPSVSTLVPSLVSATATLPLVAAVAVEMLTVSDVSSVPCAAMSPVVPVAPDTSPPAPPSAVTSRPSE